MSTKMKAAWISKAGGDWETDPEWKKVKADSETQGPLLDHIDSYFMDPTSYSGLK